MIHRTGVFLLLLVLLFLGLVVTQIDLYERMDAFFRKAERFEPDELLVLVFLVLCAALVHTRWMNNILLRKLERQMSVSETATDFYYTLEPAEEGTYKTSFLGGRYRETTGYKPGELTDSHQWLALVHPDDREKLLNTMQAFRTGKKQVVEYRLKKPDGKYVWLQDHAVPVLEKETGLVTSVNVAAYDVTEEVRDRRLRTLILDAAGEGVFGLDREGRHTFVNPAAARMLGYGCEELVGKSSHALWHHTRQDGERYPEEECPIYRVLRSGEPQTGESELFWRKDGTSFEADFVSTPLKDGEEVIGAVVIFRNVTAFKELEREREAAYDQLAMWNVKLEKRVADEVEKQRRQEQMLFYQARSAAMGEVLREIAHHWRQPLNVIGLQIQDVQDAYRTGELDDAYLDNAVETAMRTIGGMSDTIDSFRQFFVKSSGSGTFDLCKAVRETVKIAEPGMEEAGVACRFSCTCPDAGEECSAKAVIMTEGYVAELKHVVLELLNNAKEKLGRKMTVDHGFAGAVRIYVAQSQEAVILAIRDNGGPVEKEVEEKIFDPYFTTKETGEGNGGLGLFMAKSVVEKKMGGRLLFRNLEDGVEFSIRLKRA